ncbi:hypothetical protein [Pectobacterium aroidearum]|uniref:hypothetical protein n=1 Tax=Pectobacterium aroidearum TaxID=1201031 RepID=UPI003018A015
MSMMSVLVMRLYVKAVMPDCSVDTDTDTDTATMAYLYRLYLFHLHYAFRAATQGVRAAVMLRTEPASLSPPGPAVNRRAAGVHPDATAGSQSPLTETPPLYAP